MLGEGAGVEVPIVAVAARVVAVPGDAALRVAIGVGGVAARRMRTTVGHTTTDLVAESLVGATVASSFTGVAAGMAASVAVATLGRTLLEAISEAAMEAAAALGVEVAASGVEVVASGVEVAALGVEVATLVVAAALCPKSFVHTVCSFATRHPPRSFGRGHRRVLLPAKRPCAGGSEPHREACLHPAAYRLTAAHLPIAAVPPKRLQS